MQESDFETVMKIHEAELGPIVAATLVNRKKVLTEIASANAGKHPNLHFVVTKQEGSKTETIVGAMHTALTDHQLGDKQVVPYGEVPVDFGKFIETKPDGDLIVPYWVLVTPEGRKEGAGKTLVKGVLEQIAGLEKKKYRVITLTPLRGLIDYLWNVSRADGIKQPTTEQEWVDLLHAYLKKGDPAVTFHTGNGARLGRIYFVKKPESKVWVAVGMDYTEVLERMRSETKAV
jgi:hypothetical protein